MRKLYPKLCVNRNDFIENLLIIESWIFYEVLNNFSIQLNFNYFHLEFLK
jgi:hypothetical protein